MTGNGSVEDGTGVERIEIAARGMVFTARATGPADGRLVLLLHGFPETSAEWLAQLGALGAAGYRAVAFDQRGYSPGARPAEESAYDRDALVGDVLAVAAALGRGDTPFDLVGHDWGGGIAWQVAGLHPHRVRTLSVVSTPHPDAMWASTRDTASDQRERSSYMQLFRTRGKAEDVLLADGAARLRNLYHGLPDEAVAEYVALFTDPATLTAALNWYRSIEPKSLHEAGPIDLPTLFVWGEDDWALGRNAAERTAEFVRGPYRFVPLAGVGHWLPELAADELTDALLAHLAAY
ncbi:alpha/beta fold hydrolase [Yinghuangia seranimata]|uniref:alpha/beta fold hydrolase n=1 Tax=Yinghuangia seranimata TaxID=408067 RepID=UPI00248BDE75|nr:alpha/beta hydrolase [Yinghuangia seranimata]MDI2129759.1 alpha/beta hydrolase [Yinghuangia seranimata]